MRCDAYRPTIFEDLEPDEPSSKGRITAMTLAEGLDRKKIEQLLRAKYPKLEIHTYQDVVHATPHLDDPTSGDIFFFDVRLGCGLVFSTNKCAQQQTATANVCRHCAFCAHLGPNNPCRLPSLAGLGQHTFKYGAYASAS